MDKPLRILQLNSARKYIGEAAHTLNLTEALRRRGHHVWLGLRSGFETIEHARQRNLDPLAFNMPHWCWPPQDCSDAHRIIKLVREHGVNIIHVHRGREHWHAAFTQLLFRLGVRLVRTRHIVRHTRANYLNRWLARRTSALITVSRAVDDDIRATHMYDGKLVRLIPGGIDLTRMDPPSLDRHVAARERLRALCEEHGVTLGEGPVAVCVARFAKVKAHHILLPAWKQLVAELPSARLVLVGDGRWFEHNKQLARDLDVRDNVAFVGRRNDIGELLDAADAGVLASIGSEGFSRAVLEYMAKGLPAVGTLVGAIPDLIEDGVTGALAAPRDAAALCAALRRVLGATADERRAWGAAGRAKAERGNGYETWARAHEELYALALSGCAGAGMTTDAAGHQ